MNTTQTSESIVLTERDIERLTTLIARQGSNLAEAGEILSQGLETARIVEAGEVQPSVVTMHSRVVLRDEATGQTRMYTLVYPGEEDISIGNLSILTPVGVALIGLSEGETARWNTRDGRAKEMTIVEVLYQPEADGRFDL